MTRRTIMIAAIVASIIPSAGGATTAPPLQPSGKWVVEYQDKACMMARSFGEGDQQITVAFRPWPLTGQTEIVVVTPGRGPTPGEIEEGSITIGAAAAPQHLQYLLWDNTETKRRGASMTIEQQTLADMAEGDSITIRAGHKPITFAPLGLARAQKVVDKCQADLLRSWGVDPQERIAVATPETRLSHGAWINSGDYPSGAINQASIGDTTILYTIGTEGTITDCRIVGRSGTPELDAAACAAITKRGRFRPALDAAGKPLVTHETRRINWRMPR